MSGLAAAELRHLSARLREACRPAEEVFLALGHRLDEAVQVINQLTEGLGKLAGAADEEREREAIEGLRDAAHQVIATVAGLSGEAANLDNLATAVSDGSRPIARLRQTIVEVEILGINAKIHVAQISGATADFTIFTEEIARLALLAGDDLAKLDQGRAKILTMVDQARTRHWEFSRAHGQALTEVAQRLKQSLEVLESHRDRSSSVVVAICRRSAEIAILIGEAVVSLQVNDSTRQRIEHVAEAIELAADWLGPSPQGRAAEIEPGERESLAAVLCELQSIQLQKARTQFEAEVDRLLVSLDGLASDTDDLLRQEISLGGGSEQEGGIFAGLGRQLGIAEALYRRFEQARQGTQVLLGTLAEGVDEMLSHVEAVHEIEADIRIMGLNATLKCSRLGTQGLALAVIAQELRQCANRTEDQARTVGVTLQDLAERAQTLVGDNASGRDRNGMAVVAAMSQSLDFLMRTQEVFEGQLSPMVISAERAKTLLTEAAARTNIHRVMGTALGGVAAELDAVVRAGIPPGSDHRALGRRAVGLLDKRYTMAAESEIEAQFLGVAAPPPAEAEAAETDDFLF